MILLHVKQLQATEQQYMADLNAYLAARQAHKTTVNQPAPFPPHEYMRVIAERMERNGESFIVDKTDTLSAERSKTDTV